MKQVKIQPYNKLYKVCEDYEYKEIMVPSGFITDGATMQFLYYIWTVIFLYAIFAQSLYASYLGLFGYVMSWICLRFPTSSIHMTAAVVHDYMCRNGMYKQADKYFLEILLKTDRKCSAYLKYYAVRLYSNYLRDIEKLILKRLVWKKN